MRKGNLSREEAIKQAGIEIVEKVEKENCDFSNRVMDNSDVEFTASAKFVDEEGTNRTLIAYYYQDKEEVRDVDDLGNLEWEIEGYEID